MLPDAGETAWTDLTAIVIPSPSRSHDRVELRRLASSEALIALLGFPRIAGLRPDGIHARQFALLGRLAARVPTFEAFIPWGPPFALSTGPDLLAKLMSELATDR